MLAGARQHCPRPRPRAKAPRRSGDGARRCGRTSRCWRSMIDPGRATVEQPARGRRSPRPTERRLFAVRERAPGAAPLLSALALRAQSPRRGSSRARRRAALTCPALLVDPRTISGGAGRLDAPSEATPVRWRTWRPRPDARREQGSPAELAAVDPAQQAPWSPFVAGEARDDVLTGQAGASTIPPPVGSRTRGPPSVRLPRVQVRPPRSRHWYAHSIACGPQKRISALPAWLRGRRVGWRSRPRAATW